MPKRIVGVAALDDRGLLSVAAGGSKLALSPCSPMKPGSQGSCERRILAGGRNTESFGFLEVSLGRVLVRYSLYAGGLFN